MKKLISSISVLIALLILIVVTALAADPVLVESIVVETESVMVPVGKTVNIKAKVEPGKATLKKLEWSSSDESVMTVKNGTVKGIARGEAIVTAKATDSSGASIDIKVTVIQPVKKIIVTDTKLNLAPGVYHQIHATTEPENASVTDVSWKSSNEKVAVVDNTGKVTAVSKGNAKITVAAADGAGAKTTVSVKVEDYDLVFVSKKPQTLKYWYSGGAGNYKIRGFVKNGNVSIPDINTDMWTSRTGGRTNKTLEVTPLHPGTDTITIKINNSKINAKVFVADYFEEHATQYTELPDTSPDPSNGTFRDIVYGTPYSKIKDDLEQLYGENKEINDYNTGLSVTYKNPGINVAGHNVQSIKFLFCYDLNDDGTIRKDEETTSFIQAKYQFASESDNGIAEDLYNKLNELYGQTYYKFKDASIFDWHENQTYITLYNSTDVSLLYSWSTGRSKSVALDEIYNYLKGLEEQKKKEAEQSEFGSSIDGL